MKTITTSIPNLFFEVSYKGNATLNIVFYYVYPTDKKSEKPEKKIYDYETIIDIILFAEKGELIPFNRKQVTGLLEIDNDYFFLKNVLENPEDFKQQLAVKVTKIREFLDETIANYELAKKVFQIFDKI